MNYDGIGLPVIQVRGKTAISQVREAYLPCLRNPVLNFLSSLTEPENELRTPDHMRHRQTVLISFSQVLSCNTKPLTNRWYEKLYDSEQITFLSLDLSSG